MNNNTAPRVANCYSGMQAMPVKASVSAKYHNAAQQGRMGAPLSMSLGNQMGQPKGIKIPKFNSRTAMTKTPSQKMGSGSYFTAAPSMSATTQR